MRQRTRALLRRGLIWSAVGAALAASISALAQIPLPPVNPNQRQVYLASPIAPTATCPMSLGRWCPAISG
jgi:hypothetical protein